jgi:two-component system sensor histidine kinase/response regulator
LTGYVSRGERSTGPMKATILAVDDDAIILETYQAILDNEYNLHFASSAEEALNFLNAHPRVDLILLDIVMPQIDGYETCRRIRENPLFSNVKIILVSSKMRLEDKLHGYEIGADDYITKPFDASELLAKIKVFLRLKTVEEINKIKTNFISLLHHETRTPLTGIFGYTTLLQQSGNLTAQEKHFLDEIRRCGETLLRSCEKTLLLSDLKSGNIPIEKSRIPLSMYFSDYEQRWQENPADQRCQLRIHSAEGFWIDADPKLFGIVIDTLLDNAVKFARESTVVEVTAKILNDRLRVEVANQGEKVLPERQEEIFNELSVQDVAHHHEGQGLSLALARRVIEAHEGTLTVANHADGPVFVIDMKL